MSKKNIFIIFMLVFIANGIWIYVDNTKIQNEKLKAPDYIVDTQSNYLWQNEIYSKKERKAYYGQMSYQKVQTWSSAKDYCKSLIIDGISGWDLPTLNEIERAYQIVTRFKENPGWIHWSSTRVENEPSLAYSIDFNGGRVYKSKVDKTAYVRCVKRYEKK